MKREPKAGNKWLVLMTVVMGTFMVTLDAGMISVSYPALVSSLNTDASTVLWVNVSYYLISTGILLTLGWIGDVTGRRSIFIMGFLVFALGLVFSSLSQGVIQLILSRLVQGVGHSMILATGLAILAKTFPASERGKAIGIDGAMVGLGLGIGPMVGGVILDTLGWQATFYTRIPLSLAGVALGWFFLPDDRRPAGRLRVDYLGAATLFASMAAFLLMVNQGGRLGFGSPIAVSMAALTVAMVPAFVLVERRTHQPVIDLSLFKNGQFRAGLLVQIFHFLAAGATGFLLSFYLIDALGYSASKAGLFLTLLYSMRLFFSPFSGWLTDRLGYRLPSAVGIALLAIGILVLSRLGAEANPWLLAISLAIAGTGSALFEPSNSSAIMGAAGHDRLGTASASVATGRQLAMSTGMAWSAAVFTMREKAHLGGLPGQNAPTPPPVISQAFGDAMVMATILAAVGLVLALLGNRQKRASSSG